MINAQKMSTTVTVESVKLCNWKNDQSLFTSNNTNLVQLSFYHLSFVYSDQCIKAADGLNENKNPLPDSRWRL